MELENGWISIQEELSGFQQYLAASSRAILSAKFGDGKSTFLNEFMKQYGESNEKEQSEIKHVKYKFFTIYPINYQVADNKDIFEYIKRDLLVQMLSYIELEDETISNSTLFVSYLMSHKVDIIGDLLDMIPKINVLGMVKIDVKKPFEILLKNIKRLKDYKNEIKELDQTHILETYLNSFEDAKGSIYEFDAMSQFICNINKQIKEKEEKDVVLIIEDLDRIDPAHIFRILNILSAHMERNLVGANEWDANNGENKFSFDKILLVCDFENIRSIFHHFYGKDTDFKGYISKFSSHKPFHYSLKDKYKEFILGCFDPDLMNYPNVMTAVADMIIEYEQENGKIKKLSLRSIDSFLKDSPPIINKYIPINIIGELKLKVNTFNAFTKLLNICNMFSIQYDELFVKLKKGCMNELYSLIGICWLIKTERSNAPYLWLDHNGRWVVTMTTNHQRNSSYAEVITDGDAISQITFNASCLDREGSAHVFGCLEKIITELNKFIVNPNKEIGLTNLK